MHIISSGLQLKWRTDRQWH